MNILDRRRQLQQQIAQLPDDQLTQVEQCIAFLDFQKIIPSQSEVTKSLSNRASILASSEQAHTPPDSPLEAETLVVWEYLKIIQEIKPKAFVFENVPGLKSIHDGKLFEEILSELTIGGTYAISTHSYQMAEYGIPQFRERVFVIGAKNGSIVPRMLPTHGSESLLALKNYRTVREALRYLPEPGTFSTVLNHIGRKHSPRIVSRYENLKFGERDPKTRINKLHPERPSFTIIVGSDKGGGKGHIHPFVPREVTPRESARMQTFPDWWEFSGTGRHVIRQVGNAVPPLFATLLAEHVRVHIFEKKKQRSYEDFIQILGLDYLQE